MSKREAELLTSAMKEHAESAEKMKRLIELSEDQKQQEKEVAIGAFFEMAGKLKTTNFFKSQAEFFTLLMLKKIKESKEYRDRYHMNWDNFCDYVGVNWRTIDRHLADLKPFNQAFLDSFVNFSGVTFSKIKYLGLSESVTLTENAIIFNGETIPADQEHAEEIQALLETLEENHKKEKEETSATLRTKERLLKDKETTLNKMEKEIMRLEKRADKTDLTEEEQDACNLLHQVQVDIMSWFSDIKKKIQPHKAPEIALRQYYYLLIFFAKLTMDERVALNEEYKDAEEVPWEISEMELPPTDVMIDNLPMSAGKGMGKKVVAKMEERKNKKSKK